MTRRVPRIDFGHPQPSAGQWRAVMLAGLALAMGLAGGLVVWKVQELEDRRSQIDAAERQARRPQAPTADSPARVRLQAEAAVRDRLRAELGVPWESVLAQLEAAQDGAIVLDQLTLDAGERRVLIEARTTGHAIAGRYVQRLAADGRLSDVVMVRNDVQPTDGRWPFRFTVSARWQGKP